MEVVKRQPSFDAILLKSVFHFLSIFSTAYNETDFLSITRLTVMTDDVQGEHYRTFAILCLCETAFFLRGLIGIFLFHYCRPKSGLAPSCHLSTKIFT